MIALNKRDQMPRSSLCRDSEGQESRSWCRNTFMNIEMTIRRHSGSKQAWAEGAAWRGRGQNRRRSTGGEKLVLWTE